MKNPEIEAIVNETLRQFDMGSLPPATMEQLVRDVESRLKADAVRWVREWIMLFAVSKALIPLPSANAYRSSSITAAAAIPDKNQVPPTVNPLVGKAALRPVEFAAIFGKGKMWAYRLIYKGAVRVIQNCGEFRIPVSEVDRLTQKAQPYTGRHSRRGRTPKPKPKCEGGSP